MKFKTAVVDGITYIMTDAESGNPLSEEGNPVDVTGMETRIGELNNEAGGRRRELREAQDKLAKFGDIEPDAARQAIANLAGMDDEKKEMAQRIQEAREAGETAAFERYKGDLEERDTLRTSLHNEILGGMFARSSYITDKLNPPPDMIQAMFGSQFSVEDGEIVAKDALGNQLYPEGATREERFDNAMVKIIDAYPHRDSILSSSGNGGTGSTNTNRGGGGGGNQTMTRAAFDEIARTNPVRASQLMSDGLEVVDG